MFYNWRVGALSVKGNYGSDCDLSRAPGISGASTEKKVSSYFICKDKEVKIMKVSVPVGVYGDI